MVLEELVQCAGELQRAGKVPVAIRLYEDWLKAPAPGLSHVARFNLAVLLSDSWLPAEAEHQLRQAIESYPKFCQAYFNLGLAVERQGRQDEALGHWIKVTTLADLGQPDQKEVAIGALNQIGRLQEQLKNYPQAENALRQSLLLNPRQPDALQHWIHLRQKQCKWPEYEPFGEVSEFEMLMASSPLAMLALTDEPLRQSLSAHSFVSRKFNFEAGRPWQKVESKRKIRLGYVSGDLCTHAVGLLLPDFFAAHDRESFELFAFDFSPEDGSETRRRLKGCFDHFIDIRSQTDDQVSALCKQLEVDVLVDMHVLSSGARPKIFASRPAPLQLAWLGYIGTSTFPWIDNIVADKYVFPPELQTFFSERPLLVEGSFLPLRRLAKGVSFQKNLQRGEARPQIGCFNNIYKIKPSTLNNWARIVKESQAHLWMLDDNAEATKNIGSYLKTQGLSSDQYSFFGRSSYANYQEKLRSLDLYLDTYPYNAGSTAVDVLTSGTPMVTRYGETMVSRMGLSALSAIGLSELAFDNDGAFCDAAIDLLKTPAKLEKTRHRLLEKLIVFDITPTVRSLETQVKEMLRVKTLVSPK
jgi:predicted O-linked N-acetylglucosamine transferase (SPINDLY family)